MTLPPVSTPSHSSASHDTGDPPAPLLAPLLRQMQASAYDLQRVGRALNAVASLATCGNPMQSNLGVLGSEDLGALLSMLSDSVAMQTSRLELTLARAVELNQGY